MEQILKNILQKLKTAGYEAYAVGGYPRDYYLGLKTNDFDITTNARPEDVKRIFPHADDKDKKYGKVSMRQEDYTIEITTYRTENSYSKHRKPIQITYTNDLKTDLYRRDFIMNTLCMDADGKWVDLLGAMDDIRHKRIRTVGDANIKIEEDALRILRAIRFATTLDFELDDDLKAAIQLYKENLRQLSSFRKQEELKRIFESKNVEKGIHLLKEIEAQLDLSGLDTLNPHTSYLGIWAQLTYSNYEFSKSEQKEIEKLRTLLHEDILEPHILYQYGHYYCSVVAEIKGISKKHIIDAYQALPIHHRDEIAISSKELEQLVPKQMIKTVYQDLELQILSGNLENLKVFIKKYIVKNYNGRKD